MNAPVYDFPNSPVLILGFFGILVAISTLFITYNKYFNSPLNRDKKFVKNSLEFEFKKFSSKVSWNRNFLMNFIYVIKISYLSKFIFLLGDFNETYRLVLQKSIWRIITSFS